MDSDSKGGMTHEHLHKGVLVYLGDILIYTEMKVEYVKLERAMLQELQPAKLYAKLSKYEFHQSFTQRNWDGPSQSPLLHLHQKGATELRQFLLPIYPVICVNRTLHHEFIVWWAVWEKEAYAMSWAEQSAFQSMDWPQEPRDTKNHLEAVS